MKTLRLIAVVVYAAYLVHIGLLMTMLPWTEGWEVVLFHLPDEAAMVLGEPAVRGAITAFGVLHLLLAVAEAVLPPRVKRSL